MSEKRKMILVVDDEETVLFISRMAMKSAGYDVTTSSSAVEALHQLETLEPDMILLDVMMPDMNGYALCREIRKHPKTKKTPILMVTALRSQADNEDAHENGANGFLNKPVKQEDLLKKIQQFIGSPFK